MISSTKSDLIDHLSYRIPRTAEWRESNARRYPDDKRNLFAANLLRRLASEIQIADDTWWALRPHFNPDDPRWREAVGRTSRDVGFRTRPKTFSEYLDHLAANLTALQ